MKKVLLVLLVLLCQGLFGLDVELSVKECAGVGSDGYPIRTVVPVKGGIVPEYQFLPFNGCVRQHSTGSI